MIIRTFDASGINKVDSSNLPSGVTATISDIGVVTATGQPLYITGWKEETARTKVTPELGTVVYDRRAALSWQDILAFSIVVKTLHSSAYTSRPAYWAGKRELDKVSLIMIANEIADSNGGKSWNSIMQKKQEIDPIIDDFSQVDSPFNPDSIYYDPKKAVFTYDPDKGYIIYKSGEIIWTKTGGVYYDQANGQAVSYDDTRRVRFSSGNVLDLETLKLTNASGSTVTVSNELTMIQKLMRRLLTDTKTQLSVLGALFLLIILKKKRNEK